MLHLLAAAALSRHSLVSDLRQKLEQAVQGMPIHGHRFRAIVGGVAAKVPNGDSGFGVECDFKHPVGDRDSTIINLCFSVFDCISFVAVRRNHRTLVEPIDTKRDFYGNEWAAADPELAGWSGNRLCVFMHYPGGTGNSDGAHVFELSGDHWKLVKDMDAFGENTWEGAHNRETVVSSSPVDLQADLYVRVPPPGMEDRLSHGDLWFDYHQVWHFSAGRLRQTLFRRLDLPVVAMYDLIRLVRKERRGEFARRVPARFRHQLWRYLQGDDHVVHGAQPENDNTRDESPYLLIDGVLPVTMAKRHGRWVVAEIGPKQAEP